MDMRIKGGSICHCVLVNCVYCTRALNIWSPTVTITIIIYIDYHVFKA